MRAVRFKKHFIRLLPFAALFIGLSANAVDSCHDLFSKSGLSQSERLEQRLIGNVDNYSENQTPRSKITNVVAVDGFRYFEIENYDYKKPPYPSTRILRDFVRAYAWKASELGIEFQPQAGAATLLRFPTPETINRRLQKMRDINLAPDNKFKFVFASGQLSDLAYLQMIARGLVPFGTTSIFFHDMNVHFLGFAFMPKVFSELLMSDFAFTTGPLFNDLKKSGFTTADLDRLAHAAGVAVEIATAGDLYEVKSRTREAIRRRLKALEGITRLSSQSLSPKTLDALNALISKYQAYSAQLSVYGQDAF